MDDSPIPCNCISRPLTEEEKQTEIYEQSMKSHYRDRIIQYTIGYSCNAAELVMLALILWKVW